MPSYLLLRGNLHFLVLSEAHSKQAIRVTDFLNVLALSLEYLLFIGKPLSRGTLCVFMGAGGFTLHAGKCRYLNAR